MAPLSGGEGDRHIVAAAAALAEPFEAELACVHAPPDVADLIPWMGDGFMGGVQASAVDAIREAASEGAKAAAAIVDAAPYAKKSFRTLASPVWAALGCCGVRPFRRQGPRAAGRSVPTDRCPRTGPGAGGARGLFRGRRRRG